MIWGRVLIMLLNLSRLVYSAISSSRGGQAAQIEAGGVSNITLNPQPAGSETIQIGNVGITQESGTTVSTTEASAQSMLTKLESIRAVLADGDGVNIAIQNMDIDMDNLETILNGATLAENGTPTYVTNDLINDIKTAVNKLDNAIISLGQAVGTAEASLVAGTDGTNLRGLLTDNTGKLQVDIDALPTAQIGATGAANSMSVTLATDDHLLSTIDQTNDRINVNVDDATSTDGGSVPANGVMIGGTDGTNFQHLALTTAGAASIAGAVTTDVPSGTVAAAVGTTGIPVGGTDGTNFRHLKTNAAGELTVNTGLTTVGSLGEKAQTGSLSVTLATDDDLLNCVDKTSNELNVSIENGGFDGVVTTATNTQLAVTTVQSALYTAQYTPQSTAQSVTTGNLGSQATQSGLTVIADSANTATVHVGPSGVSATTGIPLVAGAAFTFSVNNANLVYAICATGSQKLNLVAM